ncbi:MAG TPA: hypothetical protein VHD33_08110 [Legionellaceae bacterium]|nr:hypothetical protein [Legionellaceae bacterium]HVW96126.1 hypothetical protein [Mucilaginibacter sp.]
MKYELIGFIKPPVETHSFAMPIYRLDDAYYLHNIKVYDTLTGFEQVNIDKEDLLMLPEPKEIEINSLANYIYYINSGKYIVGTKAEIHDQLAKIAHSLRDKPFIKKSIALFLENDSLIEEAILEIDRKIKLVKHKSDFVSRSAFLLSTIKKSNVIKYIFPRYISRDLFNFSSHTPEYIMSFMLAIRDKIEEILDVEGVVLDEVPIKNFYRIVDQILLGNVFIPEPSTAGKDRLGSADFITVGHLKYFGAVIPTTDKNNNALKLVQLLNKKPIPTPALKSSEPDDFKITDRNILGKLSDLCDKFEQYSIFCHLQPSTIVSDEFQQIIEKNKKAIGNDVTNSLDNIDKILNYSPFGSDRLGLLDYNIAYQLAKSKAISTFKYDLYIVEYDEPLPVGYFYPTNDKLFKEVLLYAVQTALIQNDGWHPDFEADSKTSLITLEPVVEFLKKYAKNDLNMKAS